MGKWLNRLRWSLGALMLSGALTMGTVALVTAGDRWGEREGWGGDDEYGEHEGRYLSSAKMPPLTPAEQQYAEECGACHIAYPAQFLPARSWQKMMTNLDNHFGENAELLPETQQAISDYLITHSADNSSERLSRKFIQRLNKNEVPLRITELAYFKRKHDEIPQRMVSGNKEVGSFSQCQACHGDLAERGVFDEDTVDIPGYGRWDD